MTWHGNPTGRESTSWAGGGDPAEREISQTIIAGGAAGDHTVTGISLLKDKLISVLFLLGAIIGLRSIGTLAISATDAITYQLTTVLNWIINGIMYNNAATGPNVATAIAGGAAGAHVVTGIELGEELVGVIALQIQEDGLTQNGAIAISAVPEQFKTVQTLYGLLNLVPFSKVAEDNIAFSAADTINTAAAAGTFWGIWLVQSTPAGVVSTKSPSADQVYADAAAALAALPAADAGNIPIARIRIQSNDTDDWIAITDDMTNGSDCLTAEFDDVDLRDAQIELDLLSEFTVTADDEIDNGGGTDTSNMSLFIEWRAGPQTLEVPFTLNHTINVGTAPGLFFGVILIEIDTDKVLYSKVPSADQVYASAALALAALPAATANRAPVGSIVLGALTGASWTANTDNMTPAGGVESAVFADAALVAAEPGSDLLSEFDITADDTINNAAGTDTTGGSLLVMSGREGANA